MVQAACSSFNLELGRKDLICSFHRLWQKAFHQFYYAHDNVYDGSVSWAKISLLPLACLMLFWKLACIHFVQCVAGVHMKCLKMLKCYFSISFLFFIQVWLLFGYCQHIVTIHYHIVAVELKCQMLAPQSGIAKRFLHKRKENLQEGNGRLCQTTSTDFQYTARAFLQQGPLPF